MNHSLRFCTALAVCSPALALAARPAPQPSCRRRWTSSPASSSSRSEQLTALRKHFRSSSTSRASPSAHSASAGRPQARSAAALHRGLQELLEGKYLTAARGASTNKLAVARPARGDDATWRQPSAARCGRAARLQAAPERESGPATTWSSDEMSGSRTTARISLLLEEEGVRRARRGKLHSKGGRVDSHWQEAEAKAPEG